MNFALGSFGVACDMKTVCDYCGTVSNSQPVGDGCHTCLAGTMQSETMPPLPEPPPCRIMKTGWFGEYETDASKLATAQWSKRNKTNLDSMT